jgi:hypothetical protein
MKTYELEGFESWIEDGNAMVIDGAWSTQDAQWCNRIETKPELWKYFLKEFFDTTPDRYFFEEIKPYMAKNIDGVWELKYTFTSDWLVDLFKLTRNAVHGRLAQGNQFDTDDFSIRIEKPTGRFARYGKVFIKELDEFEF